MTDKADKSVNDGIVTVDFTTTTRETPSIASKDDLYDLSQIDPVYYAKVKLLNEEMRRIGMGKYQWGLFVVAGFGYFADSVWPLVSGLILTPAVNEFHFRPPFLSLAANIGYLVGAAIWGLACDIWGRKWCFNLTLLISGAAAVAAGGAQSFPALAVLFAILGVGVGGNLPVDSAVFLEFIPGDRQFLLTILSVWWAGGQLLAAFIAWPLIGNLSCPEGLSECSESDNRGWRYLMFTLGGLMLVFWGLRFFAFRLLESPRYLVARGRDEQAIQVLQKVAEYNGKECTLTVSDLSDAVVKIGRDEMWASRIEASGPRTTSWSSVSYRTVMSVIDHIKALFSTRKIALSTSLLVCLWGLIGLASTLYNSFLPFLLASKGAEFGDASLAKTYRNTVILSITGVPGAFLAGWAVDLPLLGRRGTLSITCVATAVLLFGSTTARTSNALLGWNCGYTFCSNMMYGVLYAISPETFPAKDRGTGNGLVAISTRVFGVLAPIIALFANLQTAVPVYVSGALIILSSFLSLLLPFEPRGKASL